MDQLSRSDVRIAFPSNENRMTEDVITMERSGCQISEDSFFFNDENEAELI